MAIGEPSRGDSNRRLRAVAHSISLLFFAAFFAFLLEMALAGKLAVVLARQVRNLESLGVRLLLGALVDATKLIALLPAAFVVRRAQVFAPTVAALVLVMLTLLFELLVHAIVDQLWLWTIPSLLLLRLGLMALLVWLLARIFAAKRPIGATPANDGRPEVPSTTVEPQRSNRKSDPVD